MDVDMQHLIAHNDAHQAKRGASGTEGEVELLLRAVRSLQQQQQHGCDYQVDGKQDESAARASIHELRVAQRVKPRPEYLRRQERRPNGRAQSPRACDC